MATSTNDTENVRTLNDLKEQEEIVLKYELGRDEGAEIDAWEDPSFEVYHVTDHYGFIHQGKVPDQIAKLDSKLLETKLNREKKWLAMTKIQSNWEKAVKSNKVAERTYKGIPEKVRGVAWCLMLDVKRVQERNPGVYERMREASKKWSTYVRQIDLDINRTFREHIMFRRRYDIKQRALFNVLCAYSLYDLDVGYCQGMSEVAALLLMFMNEEEAFWCFATLMTNDKHNMRGFFLPSFPKLIRFKDHHDEIVRKNFKKVKKHLDKNNIHTVTFCIKWFMQCFLDRVPFTLALRLWDIYIWEGEGLLVAAAYTIIRLQRDRIMKMSDEEILRLFQSDLARDFGCGDEFVVRTLKLSMNELRQSNRLVPKRPAGSEGFAKALGSFVPPQKSDVSPDSRAATLKASSDQRNTVLVSIPADGGPELGVDALIQENESGWRTVDRYLSQECFDDKSDCSPLFTMRQMGDDGLSSCTSLASRDYESSSFYGEEAEEEVGEGGGFPASKDGHGSPDTLNGSNDIAQTARNGGEVKNKFDGNLTLKAEDRSDSWNVLPQFIIPPPKNFMNPSGASSDPEGKLRPNGKRSVQNALAFYKTIPTTSTTKTTTTGTNDLARGHPRVPCSSHANHVDPADQLLDRGMPYSQSSLGIGAESDPPISGIKYFPRYPAVHDAASPGSSWTPTYNMFKKNTSSSSSYLGKKAMQKSMQRDQSRAATKQAVSTVVIGEKSDFVLGDSPSSLFPPPPEWAVNGRAPSTAAAPKSFATTPPESFPGEPNRFHHSASDLTPRNDLLRRFVPSSRPLPDAGLYHPDYRGVTRIWTGSPAGNSSRPVDPLGKPVDLNRWPEASDVYSSPSSKTDGKKEPVFYTRF